MLATGGTAIDHVPESSRFALLGATVDEAVALTVSSSDVGARRRQSETDACG